MSLQSDDELQELSRAVGALKMEKNMIGWDLDELENMARQEMDRNSDSDDEDEDEVERMTPGPL